jgi:hypothetical protein
VDQRPWYERFFDRDNSVAPIVVLVLLVLVVGAVLTLGPMLDRAIQGPRPTATPSSQVRDVAPLALAASAYRQNG